jgi:hypothetical protein
MPAKSNIIQPPTMVRMDIPITALTIARPSALTEQSPKLAAITMNTPPHMPDPAMYSPSPALKTIATLPRIMAATPDTIRSAALIVNVFLTKLNFGWRGFVTDAITNCTCLHLKEKSGSLTLED